MRSRIALLGLLALVSVACSVGKAEQVVTPIGDSSPFPPTDTVTYCSPNGTALAADVWSPKHPRGDVPLVIFAHGGAWAGGSRSQGLSLAGVLPKLLTSGIAFASIDYRLYRPSSPTRVGDMATDVACAVQFFRTNAARWNLDAERIALLGESAGAHLVSLVGLADYLDGAAPPQAVVTIAGPTDMTVPNRLNTDPAVLEPFGATSVEDPIMKTLSPVTWVSPNAPPFLIVQGDSDSGVDPVQAQLLYDRLRVAGAPVEYLPVYGGNHTFDVLAEDPASPAIAQRVVDFLVEHLAISSARSSAAPTTTTITTTTTAPPPPDPAPPKVPDDPSALAAALVTAEQTARDGSRSDADRTAAARTAQVIYRRIGEDPSLDAAVLPAIPAELQAAVTRNIDARREAAAIPVTLQDTLPAWRIVEPAPEADLRGYYDEAAAQFGVGWEYLAAVNMIETGLGKIQGLSTAGAQGPMQFMPATWDAYGAGGDINSPHDAILAAARYLAANGFAGGDIDGALYHYNRSDHYVAAVKDMAAVLIDDPRAFSVYYRWDVYYRTTVGTVLLPTGYEASDRYPVADYLAAHPERLLG